MILLEVIQAIRASRREAPDGTASPRGEPSDRIQDGPPAAANEADILHPGGGPGSGDSAGYQRRGVAVIAFVTAMLVISSMALWLTQLTAAGARASLGHYYSTGAFYGSESGIEMALRELAQTPPTDIDSDGGIGSISNNGNTADDPSLTTARFFVEQSGSSPDTYQATGRPSAGGTAWSSYRRVVEVELQ